MGQNINYYWKKMLKGKIGKQDAFVITNNIADIIEDGLDKEFLSSYAINEKIVIGSRLIIQEVGINASDALHVLCAGWMLQESDRVLHTQFDEPSAEYNKDMLRQGAK